MLDRVGVRGRIGRRLPQRRRYQVRISDRVQALVRIIDAESQAT